MSIVYMYNILKYVINTTSKIKAIIVKLDYVLINYTFEILVKVLFWRN